MDVFIIGKEDICRCFYCGGGLQQWEPNDKPWTEHARWYTNCAFVRQFKGNELIAEHRHINLPHAVSSMHDHIVISWIFKILINLLSRLLGSG